MLDNGPPNAIISDPLHDRFRLDIAELFQRDFLLRGMSDIAYSLKKRRAHIFDAFHIIDVSPLIILPPRTRACTREQSRLGIVHDAGIIAVEKARRMAAVGRTHTTAASALHAVSLAHLGLGRATCGSGHRFQILSIVYVCTRIGIE